MPSDLYVIEFRLQNEIWNKAQTKNKNEFILTLIKVDMFVIPVDM